MVALSDTVSVTVVVAAVFVLLALGTLARLILTRERPTPPRWRLRAGVFIERDIVDDDHEE